MAIRLKDRIEANIRQSDKVNSSLSIQLNSGIATVYNGSTAKSINITPAAIGAPTLTGTGASGTWGISINGNAATATALTTSAGSSAQPVYFLNGKPVSTNVALFDKQISAGFESSLISAITGETSYSKTFLAIVRTEDAAVNYAPQHGSGIVWKRYDTQGYLYVNYSSDYAYLGGGNGTKLNWCHRIVLEDEAAWNIQATKNLPHFFLKSADIASYIGLAPQEATSGWYHVNGGDAVVLPTSNFGSVLLENDTGTPYQIFFPDNSLYAYKRWSVSGAWNSWSKMSAGYADSAGNATSATKWSTARTISLSGDLSGSVSLDGSANVTLTASVYDDSHTHAWLRNPGEHKEAASGTTGSSPNEGMLYSSGLYMTQNYTDPNTPCTYGNIINIAGAGTGQLFCEWKGTDSTSGGLWYRSHRDTTGGGWGAWRQVWCSGDSVTGAVWNDYAEYRESDCQEFGRVLTENGDDTLSISTERLQSFAGISSDTWGFCQGETEKAKTPIAVAGRVLVYPYRNRNEYKPGDVVCAAPNGTVDIMTPQEEMMYPSRIVGTVSCVPDYEEWGQGDRPAVKVNGRIWIKVY